MPAVLDAWDDHLTFTDPHVLGGLRDAWSLGEAPGTLSPRGEYAHLKRGGINLAAAELTDRQLLAVSLVFYGGVSKKRAARAMKISPQSLGDHLTAALKKIQKSLG